MSKKLKIALICPYDIFKKGGVQTLIFNLKDNYKKQGHQVKIITPLIRGGKNLNDDDIIFIGRSRDFNSPLHTTVQISASVDYDFINSILEENQFDIIHLHEPWVPFMSRQILVRSKAINIGTFHAKIPERVISRTLVKVVNPYLKSVLDYLDGLTAVSNSAKEYLTGLSSQNIEIIPNGIELKKFTFKENDQELCQRILYIGRLESRKGVKYLIDAYSEIYKINKSIELIIVGDGPSRSRLEIQAKVLGLDKIKFIGAVDDQAKIDLLKSSDLLCSPAIFGESFGIVLLEGLASGLPIVAADNSGYRDVLKDVGSLSLVNVKDKAAFVRLINIFLNQTEIRQLYRQWAQDYIVNFDNQLIADQYLKYYYSLLQQR